MRFFPSANFTKMKTRENPSVVPRRYAVGWKLPNGILLCRNLLHRLVYCLFNDSGREVLKESRLSLEVFVPGMNGQGPLPPVPERVDQRLRQHQVGHQWHLGIHRAAPDKIPVGAA